MASSMDGLANYAQQYSEKHPDLCKLVDDSEDGRLMFEIEELYE